MSELLAAKPEINFLTSLTFVLSPQSLFRALVLPAGPKGASPATQGPVTGP